MNINYYAPVQSKNFYLFLLVLHCYAIKMSYAIKKTTSSSITEGFEFKKKSFLLIGEF